MVTTFFRIIKYGFQNFWRNGWLSTATVIIMALALLMVNGLILFDVVTNSAVSSIQDKIDIAVYFKEEVIEDDILALRKSLEDLAEVKEVGYISRDQALINFRERHANEVVITSALNELSENPLLASLNIKANDSNDYPIIAEFLDNATFNEIVQKVTYNQNRTAIERLNRIIDTVNRIGFVFTIFISFVAGLVVFNTIRLAIYSNREEIGIMRLVGASNIFAKGPYVVSGILYGIVGAILALALIYPAVSISAPVFLRLIPEMDLMKYFQSNIGSFFGYLLLTGVGLGILSSWWAIRRYLRV
jgi:cell division transport system permease protein